MHVIIEFDTDEPYEEAENFDPVQLLAETPYYYIVVYEKK